MKVKQPKITEQEVKTIIDKLRKLQKPATETKARIEKDDWAHMSIFSNKGGND